MARPKQWPPRPHFHAASGQDRVRINGKDYYLGPHGSAESKQAYSRLVAAIASVDETSEYANPQISCKKSTLTIAGLLAAYLASEDVAASERDNFRYGLRPLVELAGELPAVEFSPVLLKGLQRRMVERGWSRQWCNRNLVRVRTIFRWGVSEGLLPETIDRALLTVRGLRQAKHGVEESPAVTPIPAADLAATLPHLSPAAVSAIVHLLMLTGARPSEICRMRADGIDRTGRIEIARGIWIELGKVWAYRPASHKTAHHGHQRVILLGPEAQGVLAPWLWNTVTRHVTFLFRPGRGTRGKPGEVYTRNSLRAAVHRACIRAGVQPWHPYQLRHNAASRFVTEFGWEVARVVLGHRSVEMTRHYNLESYKTAAGAVQKIG